MAISPPERIWWKPLGRQERLWVAVSVVFMLILFVSILLWSSYGRQNNPREFYRVSPAQFRQATEAFTARYRVGTEGRLPLVRPPEGDIYLMGMQFLWTPALELQKGKTYRLHVSAADVNHGLSIQPLNMNFMAVPGYETVLTITPTTAGEFSVICNEYCGLGHHVMSGKIIVRE